MGQLTGSAFPVLILRAYLAPFSTMPRAADSASFPAGGDFTGQQYYWPSTNVLVTRFRSSDRAAEITDFMPMGDSKQRDAGTLSGASKQCAVP